MKSIWKSKMVWFNLLAFVVAVAQNYGYIGQVPVGWEPFVLPAVAALNVVLRLVTDQAIKFPWRNEE